MNQIKVVLTAVSLFFAQQVMGGELEFLSNADDMRLEVLRVIPRGTEVKKGKAVMENNRFSCTFSKGQPFPDYKDEVEFVYCEHQPTGVPVVRKWRIALIHRNGNIIDVAVKIGIVR